jgi:hypothetical protein
VDKRGILWSWHVATLAIRGQRYNNVPIILLHDKKKELMREGKGEAKGGKGRKRVKGERGKGERKERYNISAGQNSSVWVDVHHDI